MPQSFRAVIFDLDGVLADSEPWWNEIDAKLLAQYGVRYRGEYHRNVLGVSYRLAVEFFKKAFGLSVSADELIQRRGEIATEFFANRVGLFPSAKEVLQELRRMNLRLAVATSSVSASARPFLDRHQLTAFFDFIVTGDEIEHGKPHPDIYLRAAEKLMSLPTRASSSRTPLLASPPPKPQKCASPRFRTDALSIHTSTKRKLTTCSAAFLKSRRSSGALPEINEEIGTTTAAE